MEIVSPATTLADGAPISRAILSPTFWAMRNQPCSFHDLISVSPHSAVTAWATRSATPFGSTPSELPSR